MSYISSKAVEPTYQRIDLETRDPRVWSETQIRQFVQILRLSDSEFLGTLDESVKLAVSNRDKNQLQLWGYICEQRAANTVFADVHGGPALAKWLDACELNSKVDEDQFESWERKREYCRPFSGGQSTFTTFECVISHSLEGNILIERGQNIALQRITRRRIMNNYHWLRLTDNKAFIEVRSPDSTYGGEPRIEKRVSRDCGAVRLRDNRPMLMAAIDDVQAIFI